MNTYTYEIEYYYHPTKEHGRRVHWMYFQCKAKSLEAGKELAHKHYTKQMRELGWTRWTTLNEIRPPKRANDTAPSKTVSPDTLPSKRKSSSGDTKRGSGTSTGDRRKTRTSKRRVKKT